MTLYCGIDLHSNNSVISVIDDLDRIIAEKRLDNDLDVIHRYLCPYQDDLEGVVVESTYNWYWLVDGLVEKGYPMHLANTMAIQQYSGIKYTNGASDAQFLAHLLRLGILPTGYIYPKATRHLRDLLRRRLMLVKQRTMQLLSLQSLIARHSGVRLNALKVKQLSEADLTNYFTTTAALFAAIQSLRQMQQLTREIQSTEAFLQAQCQQDERYPLNTSIPGVGKILGMAIQLETGPVERFREVGH